MALEKEEFERELIEAIQNATNLFEGVKAVKQYCSVSDPTSEVGFEVCALINGHVDDLDWESTVEKSTLKLGVEGVSVDPLGSFVTRQLEQAREEIVK